jgi:Entner-Doudoroff aldolase
MVEVRILSTLEHLKDAGIIAILRGQNRDRMIQRGLTLAEMGCTAIEVTLDSPHALEIVKILRQQLPPAVMVGVGTLLDVEQVKSCVEAGAEFALSPTHPAGMIQHCHAADILAVPGVSNTQELDWTIATDACIAKLFPAIEWTHEQLTSISLPWMPVGGVDEKSLWQWLDAGAWCVGMGSNLCGSDLNDSDDESATWIESEEQAARDIFMELQRRRNNA